MPSNPSAELGSTAAESALPEPDAIAQEHSNKLRELLGDVHSSENVPIEGETAPLKVVDDSPSKEDDLINIDFRIAT